MKNKKSFILYADQKELFEQLPNEKAGELIKLIFSYINDENPEPEDLLLKIAFAPIKQQLKRDLDKWEQIRQKRSDAGKKSAEKRAQSKSTSVKSVQQTSTNSTSVKSVQQTSTNSTVNVNVNDNVNDNVNVNKEIKKHPPTYEDFKNFAIQKSKENNIDLDLQKLKLKYEAWKVAGWINGKGHRIKNWKSTLLNTLKYLEKEKNSGKKKKNVSIWSSYDHEEVVNSDFDKFK